MKLEKMNDATKGTISAGRADMQSYSGATGEPFTNLYHDQIFDRIHMGKPLNLVVARAEGEQNKAIAARLALCWNACEEFAKPELLGEIICQIEVLLDDLTYIREHGMSQDALANVTANALNIADCIKEMNGGEKATKGGA